MAKERTAISNTLHRVLRSPLPGFDLVDAGNPELCFAALRALFHRAFGTRSLPLVVPALGKPRCRDCRTEIVSMKTAPQAQQGLDDPQHRRCGALKPGVKR